jgi:hypothetical protein
MFVMREAFIDALKAHRPVRRSPSDLVFPNGFPRASRLKVDAKRIGVAYKDKQRRFADFHVLRYTWATFMRKKGIADNFAIKQMRHQSIRQTDGYTDEVQLPIYTDEVQLPIYDSIKNLPGLGGCTQIRARISGADGQNVTQPVAVSEGTKSDKTLVNDRICLGLAHWSQEMNWSERRDENISGYQMFKKSSMAGNLVTGHVSPVTLICCAKPSTN